MTDWLPQTEEELVARWLNDPRYFLETCCTITDDSGVFRPFQFTPLQNRYYETVYREARPNFWVRRVTNSTEVKVRQYGSTTEKVGLQYHAVVFYNWPCLLVAYRDDIAQQIKRKADLMHESALDSIRDILNADPYTILPNFKAGISNKHEMHDHKRGVSYLFLSEKTKGAARGLTTKWIYLTDLGVWTTYDEAIAGLGGTLGKVGDEIVDRDGTGKGPGNALHEQFTECEKAEAENPGGPIRAIFYGVEDAEYTQEYLARQMTLMSPAQFRREYPRIPADAFTGDPNARFDPDHIEACQRRESRYLVDYMSDDAIRAQCIPCYAIDSAEGTPAGDYSCIKARDALTGLEIMPPYRKQASPDTTVAEMAERHRRFPGVINPLRKNHGSAIISGLSALGLTPWLYVQDNIGNCDGKIGLDENGATIPIMQMRYEIALREQSINLPSANGVLEATIFGLQKNGKIEAPPGFNDDEVVADMACVTVFEQAIRKHASMTNPPEVFVKTSMRTAEYQ